MEPKLNLIPVVDYDPTSGLPAWYLEADGSIRCADCDGLEGHRPGCRHWEAPSTPSPVVYDRVAAIGQRITAEWEADIR